jgi:hypothetical protein
MKTQINQVDVGDKATVFGDRENEGKNCVMDPRFLFSFLPSDQRDVLRSGSIVSPGLRSSLCLTVTCPSAKRLHTMYSA